MPTHRQPTTQNTTPRGGFTINYRQDTVQDAQRDSRCRNRDECGAANRALAITLALALGLIVAMVWLVGSPAPRVAQAMPGELSQSEQVQLDGDVIRVATTGDDTSGCGSEAKPCLTVQYAVDQAQEGDEIRVAGGVYGDMPNGKFQMVFLDKDLTIRGGYSNDDWTTPDPEANPTILDAKAKGRVVVIVPDIEVELEGLRFQGGNATKLGGGPDERDAGGGLYILTATVTISDSLIFSNTASIAGTVPGTEPPLGGGFGGGLYVRGGFLELTHSEILSNAAGVNIISFGGGLYLDHGDAILSQNSVMSNIASYRDYGEGGGLYLDGKMKVTEPASSGTHLDGSSASGFFSASLLDNTIQGNYGSRLEDGWGGGMFANHFHVELLNNLVQYNIGGSSGQDSRGGGLYIYFSDAWLEGNQVLYNVASGGKEGKSGGVHFCTSDSVTLRNNTIMGNIANTNGNGYGGGVSFCTSTATLSGNLILGNTATLSTTDTVLGWGGGVWASDASLWLENDLVAGNHAQDQGSGLWFGAEKEVESHLYHVTIADNTSLNDSQGVFVVTNTVAFLTNTIIARHYFGVFATHGGEATLEATLWYENVQDTAGNVDIGDLNLDGDPAFVDPAKWDYHIKEGSAAIDWGVATDVRTDMDGQPRPWGLPDLGADEIWPPSVAIRAYLPIILR